MLLGAGGSRWTLTHPVHGIVLENVSLIRTKSFHLEFEVPLLVHDLKRASIILNNDLGLVQETTLVNALIVAAVNRILSTGDHLTVEQSLQRDVGGEHAVEFAEACLVRHWWERGIQGIKGGISILNL